MSASSSSARVAFIQNEQEGFRLALMGDAVSVAASAVYFAVRLVDATFDLHVSSALNGNLQSAPPEQLLAVRRATEKYHTFLEFKQSEELRSMAISLVLPLLFMRVVGAVKDSAYSFLLGGEGNTARRVLDAVDFIVLYLTGSFVLWTIPPLEAELMRLSKGDTAWENTRMFETFDELEFCHLVALAQGGLLLLVSLLKLSARLERSSARIVERAEEFELLEKAADQQVRQEEQALAVAAEVTMGAMASAMIKQQQRNSIEASNRQVIIVEEEEEEEDEEEEVVISTGASTPALNEDSPSSPNTLPAVDDSSLSMESDEFFKRRGWKRVALPRTPLQDTTEVMASMAKMDAYSGEDGSITAMDVALGASVSAATFVLVQYLHDPIAKLLKS